MIRGDVGGIRCFMTNPNSDSSDTAAAALAILDDGERSAQERVFALVELLDRAILGASGGHGISEQILARAVAAAGRPLLEHNPASTIAATLAAAEAYAQALGTKPRACTSPAIASYPYGPGEGHPPHAPPGRAVRHLRYTLTDSGQREPSEITSVCIGSPSSF